MGFYSDMKGWYSIQKSVSVVHHINRLKRKHHMIIPMDREKAFGKKKKIPIFYKNFQTKKRGTSQLDKEIYKKPTASIIHSGEKPEPFLQRSGTGQGCLPSLLLFSIVLEVHVNAVIQGKEINGIRS